MVRNLTICNEKSNRDCHDRQLQIQRQGVGNLAPIRGKVELLSFTKESTVRRWTALLSQRNRYEGSDKDDDDGVDDDEGTHDDDSVDDDDGVDDEDDDDTFDDVGNRYKDD